jgi:hypothetical protein
LQNLIYPDIDAGLEGIRWIENGVRSADNGVGGFCVVEMNKFEVHTQLEEKTVSLQAFFLFARPLYYSSPAA